MSTNINSNFENKLKEAQDVRANEIFNDIKNKPITDMSNVGKFYNYKTNNEQFKEDFENYTTSFEEKYPDSIFNNKKRLEDLEKIKEFRNSLKVGAATDTRILEKFSLYFEKEFRKNNKEAENFMNAIIKAKNLYPDIGFHCVKDEDGAFYDPSNHCVYISVENLKNNSVIIHETTHMLHDRLWFDSTIGTDLGRDLANGCKSIRDNANMQALQEWFDIFYSKSSDLEVEAWGILYDEENVTNLDDLKNDLKEEILKMQNNSTFDTINKYYDIKGIDENTKFMLDSLGIDQETYKEIIDTNINPDELAEQLIDDKFNKNLVTLERDNGLSAYMDIIDAVFNGSFYDNGAYTSDNNFIGFYGHGGEYYSDNESVLVEIVADYGELKVNNIDTEPLESIFGKDFVSTLDTLYEAFI